MCSVTSNATRWYEQVIGVWSQVDPGSKVQEQFLTKKVTLSWVVAHLPSVASIKVWKLRTAFRLIKFVLYRRVVQYTQSESSRATLLSTRLIGSYLYSVVTLLSGSWSSIRWFLQEVRFISYLRCESTPLDFLICLVDSVRLSIKVLEVVVVGLYKM